MVCSSTSVELPPLIVVLFGSKDELLDAEALSILTVPPKICVFSRILGRGFSADFYADFFVNKKF